MGRCWQEVGKGQKQYSLKECSSWAGQKLSAPRTAEQAQFPTISVGPLLWRALTTQPSHPAFSPWPWAHPKVTLIHVSLQASALDALDASMSAPAP